MTSRFSRVVLILTAGVVTAAGPAFGQVPAGSPVPQPPAAQPPTAQPPADPPPSVTRPQALPPTVVGRDTRRLLEAEASRFRAQAEALRGVSSGLAGEAVALAYGLHSSRLSSGLLSAEERQEVRERAAQARTKAAETRERARMDRMYDEGYTALSQARYDRAIERFDQVVAMKGPRTDGALYWKAWAQDRQGQRTEALATLETLAREHPNSRYMKEAKLLEVEVRRNAGQPVRPQDQADEEMKLMALNAMQHTAPERAVPLLEKLLQSTASPRLKSRALFVLAQSSSAQALEVLKNHARGSSTPELQSRAIQYLGTRGGTSRAALAEIYGATADVDMRKRILRALMVAGEKDRLVSIARTESNPELRASAVQLLGTMGAHAELSELYQKEAIQDVKENILHALFVSGNPARMIELARTEPNPELRRMAIRNLGAMGSPGTAEALVEIYNSEQDVDARKAIVSALAMQDNATALVALARKESNPELKKALVGRLATMSGNKVAAAYMLEILEGK